ncbi:MAG: hypothetical protein ACPHCI_04970 [Solirubrobacterales bacterium]
MTLYELFVALHVFFAIAWVGGATYDLFIGKRAFAQGGAETRQWLTGFWEWIGTHYFIPVSLGTVITGIAAVIEGPWSFSEPFVSIGLGVFILLLINGLAFLEPQAKKIAAEVEEFGVESPQVTNRVSRVLNVSIFEVGILYALVFVMVVKPF